MFGKIVLNIAEIVDEYTSAITYVITFLASVQTARGWIEDNHASGFHALALTALVFIFICPILHFVFTCLMLIPKFICHMGLEMYYAMTGTDRWEKYYSDKKEENYSEFKTADGNTYGNRKENTNKDASNKGKERTKGSSAGNDNKNSGSRQAGNAYADAIKFFGLSMPFTEAELKSKYREAIKKAHPDQGGSKEEAEKVNMYYSVLKGKKA